MAGELAVLRGPIASDVGPTWRPSFVSSTSECVPIGSSIFRGAKPKLWLSIRISALSAPSPPIATQPVDTVGVGASALAAPGGSTRAEVGGWARAIGGALVEAGGGGVSIEGGATGSGPVGAGAMAVTAAEAFVAGERSGVFH